MITTVFVFVEKPEVLKEKTDDAIDMSTKNLDSKTSMLKKKPDDVTGDPTEKQDSKKNSFVCPHCTAVLSSAKNLQRHIKEVHNIDATTMICVDAMNGIYVTQKYNHSPVFPIHVIKSTNPPNIDCEVEKCRRFMKIAWSSGNPGKECAHLERTKNAKPYIKPAELQCTTLQDMLSKGLMSSEWGAKCQELNNTAITHGVDSVFPIFFIDEGYSARWYFFSVFTNLTDNWCQFRRTRVTFDSVVGRWNCQCQGNRRSHRCIHRMMGMWWLFQESPGIIVATSDTQAEDIDDLESHLFETSVICEPHNVNGSKICLMTEYLLKEKQIPCMQEIPLRLRTQEEQPPPCFVPKEGTCPYCRGPTPPALHPYKVITTQAMVYGISYVRKGQ